MGLFDKLFGQRKESTDALVASTQSVASKRPVASCSKCGKSVPPELAGRRVAGNAGFGQCGICGRVWCNDCASRRALLGVTMFQCPRCFEDLNSSISIYREIMEPVPIHGVRSLDQSSVFAMLADLNGKSALVPERFTGRKGTYSVLKEANCFGVEWNGHKVYCESNPEAFTGVLTLTRGSREFVGVPVGYIYAETPVFVGGAYLRGGESTFLFAGETDLLLIQQSKEAALRLERHIDKSFFKEDGPARPTFVLKEDPGLSLVIGDSSLDVCARPDDVV